MNRVVLIVGFAIGLCLSPNAAARHLLISDSAIATTSEDSEWDTFTSSTSTTESGDSNDDDDTDSIDFDTTFLSDSDSSDSLDVTGNSYPDGESEDTDYGPTTSSDIAVPSTPTTARPSNAPSLGPTVPIPSAEPSPDPTVSYRVDTTYDLMDSFLSDDSEVEGNFDLSGSQRLHFVVDALSTDFVNSRCTIKVAGANLTVRDDNNNVIGTADDGGELTLILNEDGDYIVTVTQTDISVNDWIVSMECGATTVDPNSFNDFLIGEEDEEIEDDSVTGSVPPEKAAKSFLGPVASVLLIVMGVVLFSAFAVLIVRCVRRRRQYQQCNDRDHLSLDETMGTSVFLR